MQDPLDLALDAARRAVRRASRLCLAVLSEAPDRPDAMAKLGREPVTIADYGSQAVVLETVAREFPGDRIVAEEGSEHLLEHAGTRGAEQLVRLVGDAIGRTTTLEEVSQWIDHDGTDGGFTWMVDPIDGTKGFLRRDQFAIAVGLFADGEVVGGVLGCPHLDDGVLYWAGRDKGAWVESLGGGEPRRIGVSAIDEAEHVRLLGSVETAHGDPALVHAVRSRAGFGGDMVRLDSQVKYAAIADGRAEIYLRPRNRPDYREKVWDHAAGVAVVEEAGGRVTDLEGVPLDFSLGARLERNLGVLATNAAVHDRVLTTLRSMRPDS